MTAIDDVARAFGAKTARSVVSVTTALRRALARLIVSGGNDSGTGRRTR